MGSKHNATVFVAESKLYALAASLSDTQFEVYDPRRKTWKVLPPQPYGYAGIVTCYFIVEKIVYLYILDLAVLSFHLEHENWKVLVDVAHQDDPHVFPTLPFAFGLPLVVTGGLAFGFVYNPDNGTAAGDDEDWDDSVTISATPLPRRGNSVRRDFMRPASPLDDKFLDALNSTRCPHVTVKFYEDFSDCMVALDGGKVLCVVSYGSGPVPRDDWRTVDPYTSFVTLSFFEVTPSSSRHPSSCDIGKYASARSIKAKLLQTAQFIIRTDELRTCGRIEACFPQGM